MSNDEHTTAEIDDDTEGHRFVPTEERIAVGDTPNTETAESSDTPADDTAADPDDPDDTDGHRWYARNVGASFDDESAEAEHDADTAESSDTPADNTAAGDTAAGDTAADADPDDTDGHRYLARNVGVVFD